MKTERASLSRGRYAKTQELADILVEIVNDFAPGLMSTRQIYYQAVSRGAVDNSPRGYDRVQRIVVQLRRAGSINYDRIVDRTRAKHQRAGWEGAEDIIASCASQFRRNIWSTQKTVVMIGLEKAALEGVFAEVVDRYGASLWTLQGYGSESYLFEWATEIRRLNSKGKHVVVQYYGDCDPTGFDIERDAVSKLLNHGSHFAWVRGGLHFGDLDAFNLINIPLKTKDTRANKYLATYGNRAAEIDALPPDELERRIVSFIETHIDHDELASVKRDEEIQLDTLRMVSTNMGRVVHFLKGAA